MTKPVELIAYQREVAKFAKSIGSSHKVRIDAIGSFICLNVLDAEGTLTAKQATLLERKVGEDLRTKGWVGSSFPMAGGGYSEDRWGCGWSRH